MKLKSGILTVALAVVLTFWCGSAMALNTEACSTDFWHEGSVCIGLLQEEDMGNFNDDTGAWEWNPAFVAEFGAWGEHPEDWQDRYSPSKGIDIRWSSFDIKRYANGPEFARVMGAYVDGTNVPRIWRVEGPNGEQTGFFVGDFMPPEGCDPEFADWEDPNGPCNVPWIDLQFDNIGTSLNLEDVVSIRWVERDALATIARVDETYKNVPYQQFPMNFWNFDRDYTEEVNWYNKFAPEVGLPAADELITVEYTFANGEVWNLQYRIPDVRVMPQVTIETVNKEDVARTTFKGKVMRDGLKIRWNDPPFREIMRPGIELKIFVGDYFTSSLEPDGESSIFHWISAPSQAHKLLIPMDNWNELKSRLQAAGHTEAVSRIIYRLRGHNDDLGTGYSNRGYSELITIPLD